MFHSDLHNSVWLSRQMLPHLGAAILAVRRVQSPQHLKPLKDSTSRSMPLLKSLFQQDSMSKTPNLWQNPKADTDTMHFTDCAQHPTWRAGSFVLAVHMWSCVFRFTEKDRTSQNKICATCCHCVQCLVILPFSCENQQNKPRKAAWKNCVMSDVSPRSKQ